VTWESGRGWGCREGGANRGTPVPSVPWERTVGTGFRCEQVDDDALWGCTNIWEKLYVAGEAVQV